jgi:hypothetical protein
MQTFGQWTRNSRVFDQRTLFINAGESTITRPRFHEDWVLGSFQRVYEDEDWVFRVLPTGLWRLDFRFLPMGFPTGLWELGFRFLRMLWGLGFRFLRMLWGLGFGVYRLRQVKWKCNEWRLPVVACSIASTGKRYSLLHTDLRSVSSKSGKWQ